MVEFAATNTSGKLDPVKLVAFETSVGIVLPDEYRNFLLGNNGCQFAQDMLFTIPGPVSESLLRGLYGLDDAESEISITRNLEIYAGRMPSTLLPIGEDVGANPICLSLAENDRGAIYYWEHELEEEEPTFSNVFLLAPTLADFIDSLQVYVVEPPVSLPSSTTIFDACEQGDLGLLQAYADAGGDLAAHDQYDRSLLTAAIYGGQQKVVQWFVEHHAPLTGGVAFAAQAKTTSIARYLLDSGADVNERWEPFFNATPLIIAAGHNGDKASVELFLERGADVNAVSNQRRTALTEAIQWKHYDIAELLLQHGANPNVDSPMGSPIEMAVSAGAVQLLESLLAHGASLAGHGEEIDSHLLLRASEKNIDIIKYLLDRGANPKARTPFGTPLQMAKKSKNPEVIALMEAAIKRK